MGRNTSGAITTSIFYFGQLTDENNNPIPLDGATEFEIGSVTKTFTTTVLASMIQERPSLLNIHINRIFPQTPTFNGQQIRIRDLADYTSGLPDSNRDAGSASCIFSGGLIEDCYDLSLMFQHLANPALSALGDLGDGQVSVGKKAFGPLNASGHDDLGNAGRGFPFL